MATELTTARSERPQYFVVSLVAVAGDRQASVVRSHADRKSARGDMESRRAAGHTAITLAREVPTRWLYSIKIGGH